MEWKQLRSLYGRKKERGERHVEVLKRKGTYDKRKSYDVEWIYYEPLNFLHEVFEDKTPNHFSTTTTDKIPAIKLIAEVEERKYIWKTPVSKRDKRVWNYMWTEVAGCIGAAEETCRSKWHELRRLYRKERERIKGQIAKLKQTGVYDGSECCRAKWKYYKYMKFLDEVSDDKTSDQNSNATTTDGNVSHQPLKDIDKFKLIAEVNKRPYLWQKGVKGSIQLFNYFWSEISEVFGVKVQTVRSKWNFLRRTYKEKYVGMRRGYPGFDDDVVKSWMYFNDLKFLNLIFDAEYKFPPLDSDDDSISDVQSDSTDSDTMETYCKIEIDDGEFANKNDTTLSRKKRRKKIKSNGKFTRKSSQSKCIDKSGLVNSEIEGESHTLIEIDQPENIESVCVKEEPTVQDYEVINFQRKPQDYLCIKKEPEVEQTTTQLNDQYNYIYTITEIKEETGDDSSLNEYEAKLSSNGFNRHQ